MGPKEKREAERQENRANRSLEIVEAAESVFFEKGLVDATMMDIASRAEISRVTLYKYFKDKGELALEVLIRAFDIFSIQLREIRDFSGNGYETLKRLSEIFYQLYSDFPDYFTFIGDFDRISMPFDESSPRTQEFYRLSQEMDGVQREAIQKGITDGSLRNDIDPEKVSLMTGDIFFSYSYRLRTRGKVLENEDQFDHSELMKLLFDLLLRSLRP